MMISRLREAIGTTVRGADKDFYEHEVAESQMMENGISYNEASGRTRLLRSVTV
jgi:hypothetical protein